MDRITSQDMPPIAMAIERSLKSVKTARANNTSAKRIVEIATRKFIEVLC